MRSLSNMIKSYAVKYEGEVKTIDTHLNWEKELMNKRKEVEALAPKSVTEGFTQGIQAVVVEEVPALEEQKEKASRILEEAKADAKQIIEQAKKEAETIKAKAYDIAKNLGYEDGLKQAKEQAGQLKAEYETKEKKLQGEYDQALSELEPKMVEIMAALIEKITGIFVEDQEEVILYLVSNALRNMDRCKEYILRVSKEDYDFVAERRPILLDAIGSEAALSVIEDKKLIKNQCLIETDRKVIDCSLDVQLGTLITDLKLLGKI